MKISVKSFLLISFLTVAIGGCGMFKRNKEESKPAPKKETPKAEMKSDTTAEPMAKEEAKPHPYESHWAYEGEKGPMKWGSLKSEYEKCETGKLQSPINLVWSQPQKTKRTIEFDYKDVPLQVIDNGHTIQVNFPTGSAAFFDGKKFDLVQMHFHTSSEHTLSGNQLPMEAHLVHKNELGQLAVIGVFLIEGRFNPFIEKIWSHIPKQKHAERVVPNLLVNAGEIVPKVKTYYFYYGSLTTPPCSEGVRWHVMNTPMELSREQIVAFRKIYSKNFRPVQATNKRNVVNY